jgi:exonuclease III
MNPDFRTFIESYDILIFQETKTDELDVLELPNEYTCFAKHRRNAKAKSGGIVIVFKRYLLKSLAFISSESAGFINFDIKPQTFKLHISIHF